MHFLTPVATAENAPNPKRTSGPKKTTSDDSPANGPSGKQNSRAGTTTPTNSTKPHIQPETSDYTASRTSTKTIDRTTDLKLNFKELTHATIRVRVAVTGSC